MAARRDLWPGLFTTCLFALFAPSLVLGSTLLLDSSVRYWVGRSPQLIFLVPVLVMVGHIVHTLARRPRFFTTLLSTVIPAFIVLLVGYLTLLQTGHRVTELVSSDCTTYTDKYDLEAAYKEASRLFDLCVERVAHENHASSEATRAFIGVGDCVEYQDALKTSSFAPQWWYLEELETSQVCSGWCTSGDPALWSRTHFVSETCSRTAALVLETKVNRTANHMLFTGMLNFLIFIAAIACMQEVMIKRHGNW